MRAHEILSQEELDALLKGVQAGDVATGSEAAASLGEVQPYEFADHEHIVRGRMPTLEMINERFARLFRVTLFNLLQQSLQISVSGVQMIKFGEYVNQLFVPANMNLVKIKPLQGTSLFVFDANLVFLIVERYFGGGARDQGGAADTVKEFTAAEIRVVQLILSNIFTDLKEAWGPVMPVDFEYLDSEVNPHFANIVSPTEAVVVTTFHVELQNGAGDLHITLPYSMIEPIRELLLAGVQSDRSEGDRRWLVELKEGIRDACVEVKSAMVNRQVTLCELLALKPGDVLPVEISDTLVAHVDGVPVFNARLGTSRGHLALEVSEPLTGGLQALMSFQQEQNRE
jgi:flagellar motor switch protein FliM